MDSVDKVHFQWACVLIGRGERHTHIKSIRGSVYSSGDIDGDQTVHVSSTFVDYVLFISEVGNSQDHSRSRVGTSSGLIESDNQIECVVEEESTVDSGGVLLMNDRACTDEERKSGVERDRNGDILSWVGIIMDSGTVVEVVEFGGVGEVENGSTA